MDPSSAVFLLDCDNTLLDNDRVQEDLRQHLTREFGAANCARYWKHFEDLRQELGYVDYLGALQRYRLDDVHDPKVLLMSAWLVDYPFADRLYPHALDGLKHLSRLGTTAILSDGDVVFQPRKIQRSGLWDAVDGRVMIYVHKEEMLDDVRERYPAQRYFMVDDKLHVLAAMKAIWRERLTTVFVRQGHYAFDPTIVSSSPPADITIERIGELVQFDLQEVT